jgi:ATP-dependent Clp protease ATP-binding subunit ClpA
MFERFTDRARRTVVHAQDEARQLQHNYIGTEHLLLGLLGEPDGVAAIALSQFDITPAAVREDVLRMIGMGQQEPSGRKIPFTPRAKKVLELSLREALQLNHNYIGTEHILLGLVREGEGVAAQILTSRAGDLSFVRAAVLDIIPPSSAGQGRRWLRRRQAVAEPVRLRTRESWDFRPPGSAELRTTPAADASLEEATRLAGGSPVGSHHMLLAALNDPNTAAARALIALGVDLDRARAVLRQAEVTGSSDELPEEAGRRQMLVRVSDDRLTIEAADQAIVKLGRAALDAIKAGGGRAGETGEGAKAVGAKAVGAKAGGGEAGGGEAGGEADVIRGDQPGSASLAAVWQSLHDSLEDIRRRAAAAARDAQAASDAPATDTPAEGESEPGAEAAGG